MYIYNEWNPPLFSYGNYRIVSDSIEFVSLNLRPNFETDISVTEEYDSTIDTLVLMVDTCIFNRTRINGSDNIWIDSVTTISGVNYIFTSKSLKNISLKDSLLTFIKTDYINPYTELKEELMYNYKVRNPKTNIIKIEATVIPPCNFMALSQRYLYKNRIIYFKHRTFTANKTYTVVQ